MANSKSSMRMEADPQRLETPRSIGYRAGMTTPGVIGRRLERLYVVPSETPRRIDELLQVLDDGGERRR